MSLTASPSSLQQSAARASLARSPLLSLGPSSQSFVLATHPPASLLSRGSGCVVDPATVSDSEIPCLLPVSPSESDYEESTGKGSSVLSESRDSSQAGYAALEGRLDSQPSRVIKRASSVLAAGVLSSLNDNGLASCRSLHTTVESLSNGNAGFFGRTTSASEVDLGTCESLHQGQADALCARESFEHESYRGKLGFRVNPSPVQVGDRTDACCGSVGMCLATPSSNGVAVDFQEPAERRKQNFQHQSGRKQQLACADTDSACDLRPVCVRLSMPSPTALSCSSPSVLCSSFSFPSASGDPAADASFILSRPSVSGTENSFESVTSLPMTASPSVPIPGENKQSVCLATLSPTRRIVALRDSPDNQKRLISFLRRRYSGDIPRYKPLLAQHVGVTAISQLTSSSVDQLWEVVKLFGCEKEATQVCMSSREGEEGHDFSDDGTEASVGETARGGKESVGKAEGQESTLVSGQAEHLSGHPQVQRGNHCPFVSSSDVSTSGETNTISLSNSHLSDNLGTGTPVGPEEGNSTTREGEPNRVFGVQQSGVLGIQVDSDLLTQLGHVPGDKPSSSSPPANLSGVEGDMQQLQQWHQSCPPSVHVEGVRGDDPGRVVGGIADFSSASSPPQTAPGISDASVVDPSYIQYQSASDRCDKAVAGSCPGVTTNSPVCVAAAYMPSPATPVVSPSSFSSSRDYYNHQMDGPQPLPVPPPQQRPVEWWAGNAANFSESQQQQQTTPVFPSSPAPGPGGTLYAVSSFSSVPEAAPDNGSGQMSLSSAPTESCGVGGGRGGNCSLPDGVGTVLAGKPPGDQHQPGTSAQTVVMSPGSATTASVFNSPGESSLSNSPAGQQPVLVRAVSSGTVSGHVPQHGAQQVPISSQQTAIGSQFTNTSPLAASKILHEQPHLQLPEAMTGACAGGSGVVGSSGGYVMPCIQGQFVQCPGGGMGQQQPGLLLPPGGPLPPYYFGPPDALRHPSPPPLEKLVIGVGGMLPPHQTDTNPNSTKGVGSCVAANAAQRGGVVCVPSQQSSPSTVPATKPASKKSRQRRPRTSEGPLGNSNNAPVADGAEGGDGLPPPVRPPPPQQTKRSRKRGANSGSADGTGEAAPPRQPRPWQHTARCKKSGRFCTREEAAQAEAEAQGPAAAASGGTPASSGNTAETTQEGRAPASGDGTHRPGTGDAPSSLGFLAGVTATNAHGPEGLRAAGAHPDHWAAGGGAVLPVIPLLGSGLDSSEPSGTVDPIGVRDLSSKDECDQVDKAARAEVGGEQSGGAVKSERATGPTQAREEGESPGQPAKRPQKKRRAKKETEGSVEDKNGSFQVATGQHHQSSISSPIEAPSPSQCASALPPCGPMKEESILPQAASQIMTSPESGYPGSPALWPQQQSLVSCTMAPSSSASSGGCLSFVGSTNNPTGGLYGRGGGGQVSPGRDPCYTSQNTPYVAAGGYPSGAMSGLSPPQLGVAMSCSPVGSSNISVSSLNSPQAGPAGDLGSDVSRTHAMACGVADSSPSHATRTGGGGAGQAVPNGVGSPTFHSDDDVNSMGGLVGVGSWSQPGTGGSRGLQGTSPSTEYACGGIMVSHPDNTTASAGNAPPNCVMYQQQSPQSLPVSPHEHSQRQLDYYGSWGNASSHTLRDAHGGSNSSPSHPPSFYQGRDPDGAAGEAPRGTSNSTSHLFAGTGGGAPQSSEWRVFASESGGGLQQTNRLAGGAAASTPCSHGPATTPASSNCSANCPSQVGSGASPQPSAATAQLLSATHQPGLFGSQGMASCCGNVNMLMGSPGSSTVECPDRGSVRADGGWLLAGPTGGEGTNRSGDQGGGPGVSMPETLLRSPAPDATHRSVIISLGTEDEEDDDQPRDRQEDEGSYFQRSAPPLSPLLLCDYHPLL